VFSVDFLCRVAERDMPLHLAHKKIPICNDSGEIVKPDTPNGYKFEKFIFDVLPMAEKSVNVTFLREDEFSPVKNATGADSPDSTKRDMMLKWARWLERAGVTVPRDTEGQPSVRIEIDPCYAMSADDLKQKLPEDFLINEDLLLE
jgi:UDP-N-acetylglucosamine/UDP-N-acetylgalactosamine diphosphorylase